MEKKNYARNFNDKVLNEKYEQELYRNQKIKRDIKRLRDDMVYYSIASAWLLLIIFFTKFTIAGMALFLFLNYKMNCLSKKYIYHIGFMFVVAAIFAVGKLSVLDRTSVLIFASPILIIGPVIIFLLFLAYFIVAIVCALKYWFFVVPSMVRVSRFFHRYNLGLQRITSDEKLYRLESEVMARRKKAEQEELNQLMNEDGMSMDALPN